MARYLSEQVPIIRFTRRPIRRMLLEVGEMYFTLRFFPQTFSLLFFFSNSFQLINLAIHETGSRPLGVNVAPSMFAYRLLSSSRYVGAKLI